MFYTIYKSLCKEKGVSASKAAEEAEISTSSVTKWKKGATLVICSTTQTA